MSGLSFEISADLLHGFGHGRADEQLQLGGVGGPANRTSQVKIKRDFFMVFVNSHGTRSRGL